MKVRNSKGEHSMKLCYYLSTCDTSKRIMKALNLDGFELREIKSYALTEEELDLMKKMSGSFESLFSRRARKYKELGLKDKTLSEKDYRKLILSDYTFLQRPVFLIENEIFIGSGKSNVNRLTAKLGNKIKSS